MRASDYSEPNKKKKKSKNDKANDDEDPNKPKDDIKPVSFFSMFRYATTKDRLLYFIGFLGAIATGLTTPANSLIFGNLTNVSYIDRYWSNYSFFNLHLRVQDMIKNSGLAQGAKYTRNDDYSEALLDAVQNFSLNNTYIGIVMLVCSYISVTCFNYAAHSQIMSVRSKFFKSVLHQDMSWYDVNQSGEVASRMNE